MITFSHEIKCVNIMRRIKAEEDRFLQQCGQTSLHKTLVGNTNLHTCSGAYHRSQRTRGAIITSLLRQNDVMTSFWRNNDVIITSCVRWDVVSVVISNNLSSWNPCMPFGNRHGSIYKTEMYVQIVTYIYDWHWSFGAIMCHICTQWLVWIIHVISIFKTGLPRAFHACK